MVTRFYGQIGYKSQADKGNVKLLQGSLNWPSAKTRLRLNFQGRATLTTPARIAYCLFNISSSGVNQYTELTGPLSCVKAQSTVLTACNLTIRCARDFVRTITAS